MGNIYIHGTFDNRISKCNAHGSNGVLRLSPLLSIIPSTFKEMYEEAKGLAIKVQPTPAT
jgi:hypothetical protein